MGDFIEVTLWPKHPRTIYHVTSSAFMFEVKAERSLSIVLATNLEHTSKCSIVLGMNNNQGSIISNGDNAMTFDTENVLSNDEFRKFWLTWFNGRVKLGRDRELQPIIEAEHHILNMQYISFGALDQSGSISLKFDLAPLRSPEKSMYFDDGKPVWQTGVEQLPLGAVIGGIDNEPQYVIRARHNGSLTPGRFVPSEGLGYVPWGGNANAKENFEVLCGYNFKWVKSSKGIIPIGATPSGHAEGTHEPLYVGRATHEGSLIPGKVQPSHSVCYIPYNGKEVAKPQYEILVQVEDPRRMRYALTPDEYPEQYLYDEDNDSDEFDIRRQRVIVLNH